MKTLAIQAWQLQNGDVWSDEYEIRDVRVASDEDLVYATLYHVRSHKTWPGEYHVTSQLTVKEALK